jgi:AraC-like DNA-binding protein
MLFSEISPYVRFARHLDLNEKAGFDEVIPLDARLFYTLEGEGRITVKNKEYTLPKSSLLIINSGTPYMIMPPESFVSYIVLNFDYTDAAAKAFSLPVFPIPREEFETDMLVDFRSFEDEPCLFDVLYVREIPELRKRLLTLVGEFSQKLLYYQSKCSHILAECISDALRLVKIGSAETGKDTINRIITYVHDHYSENITNADLAAIFGYHKNYVSALIKRLTGMPIHRYLLYVRLTNAARLLETTEVSCEEISVATGFYDAAYFSRAFKSHFGVSPSKYRSV